MKKLLISLLLMSATAMSYSQSNITAKYRSTGKNLVKLNLLSLPLNNFSFQYERAVANKITVGLGYRFMPESGLPLKSTFANLIDDPEAESELADFRTSNSAITPEIRFYMGKQAMRGFYLAPFARFSTYKAKYPLEYEVQNGTTGIMPLTGKLNTVTGGLLMGAQWKLGGGIYLDWWMLGPQYGSADGMLDGRKTLSAEEQAALREELENIEIPFARTSSTVNGQGATLNVEGPWAGLRTGLCLGIRF